jgi:hypothetical protein
MSPILFSPEAIARIVSETIPAVTDPSHRNAIVATVDMTGAQVLARFEYDTKHGWLIDTDAIVRHDWGGDTQAGTRVVLKW